MFVGREKVQNLLAGVSFLAGSVTTACTAPNGLVLAGGFGLSVMAASVLAAEKISRLKTNFMRVATLAGPVANLALIANGTAMLEIASSTTSFAGGFLALGNMIYLIANTNGMNYFWHSEECRDGAGISPQAHGAMSTAAAACITSAGAVLSDPVLIGIGSAFLLDAGLRWSNGSSLKAAFREGVSKLHPAAVLKTARQAFSIPFSPQP